jgi:hypothetical protein
MADFSIGKFNAMFYELRKAMLSSESLHFSVIFIRCKLLNQPILHSGEHLRPFQNLSCVCEIEGEVEVVNCRGAGVHDASGVIRDAVCSENGVVGEAKMILARTDAWLEESASLVQQPFVEVIHLGAAVDSEVRVGSLSGFFVQLLNGQMIRVCLEDYCRSVWWLYHFELE